MGLIKGKIVFLLLFLVMKLTAQCPPGATYYSDTNVSSNQFSDGVYCLEGVVSAPHSLGLGNTSRIIVMPDSKFEITGYFNFGGVLEVYGEVEVNGGMSPTNESILDIKSNAYFSITEAVNNFNSNIRMGDNSVFESCGPFYTQKTNGPLVSYTGTGSKAYFITKNEASSWWNRPDPILIGDDPNLVWIAMGSVLGVVPGNATYCGPNASPETCPSLWPEGLTKNGGCFEAEEIISELPSCTEFLASEDSAWNNSANWTNGVPGLTKCAIVLEGNEVEIHSLAQVGSLTIKPNAKVTINESGVLVLESFLHNESESTDFVIKDGGQLAQLSNDAVNHGEYTVQRNFNFSPERNQYNFVISPAIGQTIQEIYPGNPIVIKLNEADDWFYSAPGGGIYIPGKGYAIKEAATEFVPMNYVKAEFKGEIPNGNISYILKKDSWGTNLVGNPYPSAIDSKLFYEKNKELITPNLYFWDNRGNVNISQQGSNYDGSNYATLNALTGIGVSASGTLSLEPKVPTHVISVGTAFLVEAKVGDEQLVFDNSIRIERGEGPDFYGRSLEESEKDAYWLTLQSPNGMETMTAVAYFEGGNDDFYYDDTAAFQTSDELYSIIGEQKLIIQGKSSFQVKDKIPLGVRMFNSGVHIISLYDVQGVFAEGQSIYLRDKKAKIIHDLKKGPYKFGSLAGEDNTRFEIIYRKLDSLLAEASIFSKVQITQEAQEIVIKSNEQQITRVEVFDLYGKSLCKIDANSLELRFPIQHARKQILIVKVRTESGQIVTQKLIH